MELIQKLIAPGKGLLAADQGSASLARQLEAINLKSTDTAFPEYQAMLFRTPGLADYVSGVIMTEEAATVNALDGQPLVDIVTERGMIPGISPSTGVVPLAGSPNELISEGLDGLRERLTKYYAQGFRFSKWRGAIRIGPDIPTAYAIKANTHVLAQFAAISQEVGLIPIVEPEAELRGNHTIERCFAVTEWLLHETFYALYHQGVDFERMLLKTNMVVPGEDCPHRADVDTVAALTLQCLRRTVPPAVAGITFLSGGQTDLNATAHLNAMNALGPQPWKLTFSYARALQRAPMQAWSVKSENIPAGQAALAHRAKMNSLAATGQWSAEREQTT